MWLTWGISKGCKSFWIPVVKSGGTECVFKCFTTSRRDAVFERQEKLQLSSIIPGFSPLPRPAVLGEVLFRAQQPGSLGKKAPWRGKAASKMAPEHPQLLTCCSLDKYLEIIWKKIFKKCFSCLETKLLTAAVGQQKQQFHLSQIWLVKAAGTSTAGPVLEVMTWVK